jgi:hypothetical protein
LLIHFFARRFFLFLGYLLSFLVVGIPVLLKYYEFRIYPAYFFSTLCSAFMNEDSGKSKLTIFAWVIAANIAAWGLYFYFDRFVGIDFDMIRRVNYG